MLDVKHLENILNNAVSTSILLCVVLSLSVCGGVLLLSLHNKELLINLCASHLTLTTC